ncbi:MAG: VOC family protein [Planctomycetota bacterium]
MARLLGTSAVLLVRDALASAEYFRDKAGFTIGGLWPDPSSEPDAGPPCFAIVHRDGMCLMLADHDPDRPLTPPGDPAAAGVPYLPNWKHRDKTAQVYFWVDDVDALYAELMERGATHDFGPCDQPHGCREFGIQDLDDHDVVFGQVIDGD